ncbi:hemerythrin domain-containing protein [Sphingopyxis sp. SE2]|uniref:hemerythrin domain-containing protein n=1 Tax=Sphingopyxis sp. SE2 TaxID=1586240 RepID=UPI0028C12E84|nr:hemerythrin domain-containing protein [Sphingopyxis sp. SE2]MDT7527769.1 hemerythrin domain-containing protein [Sphingopyxis sp. SE2]
MDILGVFLSEHEHVRLMLGVFEEELAEFGDARNADYEVLGGCIAYCRDFLDQWHHPREDRLLELISRRDYGVGSSLQALSNQHQDLGRRTAELTHIFHDICNCGGVYLREDLVETGRRLSSSYRQHLDWEERFLFPAATTVLTDEDWQELASRTSGEADPLSAEPVDRQYRMLFAALADRRP